ncbi:MAG TPA: S8 family serine peptidase, partial [Bacteroidales bacterium]|nr:S8 family serine peptidase [Bacteroidales bacterium]
MTNKALLNSLLLSLLFSVSNFLFSQNDCTVTLDHGQGYTTAIQSVTLSGPDTYDIVLNVKHNGCSGSCKAMARYSVEADPGSYTNVSIEIIEGSFNYSNIDLGPDLGGDPFQGFRVTGTAGFGNGVPGEFTISYTLTGGLQDQQTLVKAGNKLLTVSFSIADFDAVLNCNNSNIFPYYAPPDGGKLDNSLIGPELTSLYETFQATGTAVSDNIFQIDGSTVLIRIFALSGQYSNLLDTLTSPAFGLTDPKGIPGQLSISGWYPIDNLLLINDLTTEVNYARPEYPAQVNAGLINSQGDVAMRSDIARNAFLLDGEGIKVGVLSDSYNKKIGNPANDDVLKGDLPGIGVNANGDSIPNPENDTDVEVLLDFPYQGSDEGRAMLQIIHDVAPKADLAFRTGVLNPIDFAQGIIDLKDAGCDVIVDDITYISEPFFEDGLVAQTVNSVVSQGVAYFSAAGNFGTNSYESYFNDAPTPTGLSGTAHNFAASGTDIYQSISVDEGNYTVVLQWDDGSGFSSTQTDLDIYLANDNGSTLFGFNRNNIGGNPVEVLPFTVGPGGAETNILILKSAGLTNVRIKYIVFRGQLTMNEYATVANSTIFGHPNAENAITVGAVLYSNTPAYGVNPPTIASFSSRGGLEVNGQIRMKPDIAAPNGVNTSVDFGSLNIDSDPFPNFFGTSAAAPHAAGVAALILQATNKFYGTPLSPLSLKTIMSGTAIDMNIPGFDNATGNGFIQADAALLTLANPSPVITDLVYDTTLQPGVDTLVVTINGDYLTEGALVIFNGDTINEGIVLQGDTAIITSIYPFNDLYPGLQVYNPPNSETNGTDGGASNILYFNEKESVVITINNASKVYGESLPEFTASYQVVSPDGSIPLDSAGLTTEELTRIMNLGFVAPNVSELTNAGIWAIEADPSDPLNPESGLIATDSVDTALLHRFNFVIL